MSKQVQSRQLFHKGHYNIIAARIREVYAEANQYPLNDGYVVGGLAHFNDGMRIALENFALGLAQSLLEDNPTNFNPSVFLERAGFDVHRLLQRLEHRKAGLPSDDKDSGSDVS